MVVYEIVLYNTQNQNTVPQIDLAESAGRLKGIRLGSTAVEIAEDDRMTWSLLRPALKRPSSIMHSFVFLEIERFIIHGK